MATTHDTSRRIAEFEGAQALAYVQFLTDGTPLLPDSLVLALAQLKCRATAAFSAARSAR